MKKVLVAGPAGSSDTCVEDCIYAMRRPDVEVFLSMEPGDVEDCDGVIFPGGEPDVNPAFWGAENTGSLAVNDELDSQQIIILEKALSLNKPILGICRGYQLLNVYFGGTLIQDIRHGDVHRYVENVETVHSSVCVPNTLLHELYGGSPVINTKHHQALWRIASCLRAIQFWFSDSVTAGEQVEWMERASQDRITEGTDDCMIEAFVHRTLPIIGVQWHPEKMAICPADGTADAVKLFDYFASLL